jgi:hypothetical protein
MQKKKSEVKWKEGGQIIESKRREEQKGTQTPRLAATILNTKLNYLVRSVSLHS